MFEENISQEHKLKTINEARLYFVEEIDQNVLMNNKHKKVCATLNYIEHFLTLASAVPRCISTSAFAFLLGILIRITSFAIGLKICVITEGIKKYKSIIKKKKKKPKGLINSNISHEKFVLINNVLKAKRI